MKAPSRWRSPRSRGKGLTADYVLEYRNTKLAVVEAKALKEALTLGWAQAKNYAGKLAVRFAHATNEQKRVEIFPRLRGIPEVPLRTTPCCTRYR